MMSPPYSAQFPVNYSGGLNVPMEYARSRSASFSYPQQYYPQQYMQQQPYMPGVPTSAPGSLVIIQQPKKRKSRRLRGSDGDYEDNMSSRSSRR